MHIYNISQKKLLKLYTHWVQESILSRLIINILSQFFTQRGGMVLTRKIGICLLFTEMPLTAFDFTIGQVIAFISLSHTSRKLNTKPMLKAASLSLFYSFLYLQFAPYTKP